MTFQTYNIDVPNPPNRPSSDVPLMKVNTNSISAWVTQDHFGFNDNAGGNHKQVHLKNTAAPGGIGANADSVFYSNVSAGNAQPFWQNAITSYLMLNVDSSSLATNGFLKLNNGFTIEFGKVVAPASTTGVVVFPTAFSNNVFGVFMTLARNSSGNDGIWINTAGTNNLTQFAWRSSTSLPNPGDFFYWLAIGN